MGSAAWRLRVGLRFGDDGTLAFCGVKSREAPQSESFGEGRLVSPGGLPRAVTAGWAPGRMQPQSTDAGGSAGDLELRLGCASLSRRTGASPRLTRQLGMLMCGVVNLSCFTAWEGG